MRLTHRYLRACGAVMVAGVLVGCGSKEQQGSQAGLDGGGPGVSQVARIDVAPSAVLLTTPGQTHALKARAFDAQGAEIPAAVSWTSSKPDQVTVDATGQLTAKALGSAQIVAEAGGVKSTPAVVLVAEPAAGALLVSDAQVVSVAAPVVSPGSVPGVGTRYDVTLRNVPSAPAPGTVVLAGESAPVAGKVISSRTDTGNLVVTLELRPLYEVLARYHLELAIPLGGYALEPIQAQAPSAPPSHRSWPAPRSAALATGNPPITELGCTGELKASFAAEPTVSLSPGVDLTFIAEDFRDDPSLPPGHVKHALSGKFTLTGEVAFEFTPGAKATLSCSVQRRINLQLGLLSLLVTPAIRIGAGAEIEAEIKVVQSKVGLSGTIGFSVLAGWECGSGQVCTKLNDVAFISDFKPEWNAPSTHQMEVDVKAQIFGIAGLDLAFVEGLAGDFEVLEVTSGPKQTASFAFEDDQAHEPSIRANYALSWDTVVQPGAGLQAAIKRVIDDDAVSVNLSKTLTARISESPRGTLAVDHTRTGIGRKVVFTVDLAPESVNYLGLGYNVVEVDVYRRKDPEMQFTRLAPALPLSSAATRFTAEWMPTEADLGVNEFVAFVKTGLHDYAELPLLEVADDSRTNVDVLCFSPPALVWRAADLTVTAPATAPTCKDAWSSTIVTDSPSSGTVIIHQDMRIHWETVVSQAPPLTQYAPQGTVTLAMHSPEPGCTIELQPSTFTIPSGAPTFSAMLVIDYTQDHPFYSFGVQEVANFTSTVTCPGRDPVITDFSGFPILAAGFGTLTAPTDVAFNGESVTPEVRATWSFSRN